MDEALSRARLAVACAELGHEQHVDFTGAVRPLLEELIDEGALDRVVVLIEREEPRARLAMSPRRGTGAPRVAELLEEDHRRLDGLAWQAVETAPRDGRRAADLARAFDAGLRRHFRIEEDVLFPLLESEGPSHAHTTTARMRLEHQAVLLYLTRLVAAAEALGGHGRPSAVAIAALEQAHCGLAAVLAEHNAREEIALFPVLDGVIDATVRAAVVRRVLLF